MSSCRNPRNFLLQKKGRKRGLIELENSPENSSSCQEIAPENLDSTDASSSGNGEVSVEGTGYLRESEKQITGDDDGFTTPTSFHYKIPAITQCPPPPKKIRSARLKRRESPACRRSLNFGASGEVESIFLHV
ncbi:hypothetical protein Salat_0998200 [Sesamum alatum]|uniref:Uncharacterized protein n=1 Tax=Sesamum alatum TaxID=300844 RepID=A0AAE1YM60_9LAMI|nr:hypothetical protein Salat_0998200 [Sesamum alatum]